MKENEFSLADKVGDFYHVLYDEYNFESARLLLSKIQAEFFQRPFPLSEALQKLDLFAEEAAKVTRYKAVENPDDSEYFLDQAAGYKKALEKLQNVNVTKRHLGYSWEK